MFGKRLKKLREQAGLFQEAVAEAVGTSSRNIGYYENMDRRPNPEMLIKLANFYNVSVDYLWGYGIILITFLHRLPCQI